MHKVAASDSGQNVSGGDGAGGAGGAADAPDAGAPEIGPDAEASCNTVQACGPACTPCSAPLHGTATCLDGTCGVTCENGYVAGGQKCVLATLHVSAVVGNDGVENDGSVGKPFKSFRRAMSEAVSQVRVVFDSGEYGLAATGDDFKQAIPKDVTLERHPEADPRSVSFSGSREESTVLTFEGNGTLIGIDLVHFTAPLFATTGSQRVEDVNILEQRGSVQVKGEARMSWNLTAVETMQSPGAFPLVLVSGNAGLDLSNVRFTPDYSLTCSTPADVIRVKNSASATLDTVTMGGGFALGLMVEPDSGGGGLLHIRDSAIQQRCPGNGTSAMIGTDSAKTELQVSVEGSTFDGNVTIWGTPKMVKVRGSTFRGQVGLTLILGRGLTYDLGAAEDNDRGKNTFYDQADQLVGLELLGGDNVVVNAIGNTWAPGAQGASGYGQYEERRVITGPAEGRNVTIRSSLAEVRL